MKTHLLVSACLYIAFCACIAAPGLNAQSATGTRGAASSAHPLATRAGIDILRKGGNAFDAAVAMAAALNVVEPDMSGIGGYGTIMIYDAKKREARFLNPSGRIPYAVDSDTYRPPTPNYLENRRGAKAVSTPGNAHAWEAMWKAYGTLKWPDLFQAAIRLAENGYALDARGVRSVTSAWKEFPEHARAIFGRDDQPLKEGETLVQKDLALSLRLIAKDGAAAIYGGTLGEAIDATMKESGGFLSMEDLRRHQTEWRDPIRITYRECEVVTASPPANTFDFLVRLGIMSRFNLVELGHNSAAFLHRFAEATKHGFWVRLKYAGDPEINPPPLQMLLSEDYWAKIAGTMDLQRATPFVPPMPEEKKDSHTTHFVVADRWGNVVSATQTLGNAFGSRIMPRGTGFWLNNSLAYSTFEPKGNPMDAHAGRRKLSGDCPTILFRNGKPWVSIGTPGGHTIGQTVPQMVMNLVDFRMDIFDAIAAARISFEEPDLLTVEDNIPVAVREALAAMGHKIRTTRALGNAHGLAIEYNSAGKPIRFTAAADPRGSGKAAGY